MTTTRKITRRPMINADATIENVEFLLADSVHPTQIAARTGYKHVDHLIRMLRRKQRDDLATQLFADRDELRVGAGARKGRIAA
ncbi:hypothetical protein [Naumannella halotolerans]|uniref:HTH araC/xylS-type domain-containing protein n=1 Tax=Naumannella halotolerans TaxID=993414 RepID=A0A4R7J1U8_9ACTN|nr:hypothetical protein [Naumannella halotolerans]TDT31131.1 hypothetical protein CLV29_2544 [Naumannella halotolerans]